MRADMTWKGIAARLLAAGMALAGCTMTFAADDAVTARRRMMERVEDLFTRTARDTGRAAPSARVREALLAVPRDAFVPLERRGEAYADRPLAIGHGQTISQPYIVALMTELADLKPADRVLEVGTGSGYQAAILSRLVAEVYSIEIVPGLGREAAATLAGLGYDNIRVRIGDGYLGWPQAAPFDAVIVTAAPDHLPAALIEQLKPGGRLVIPVGGADQDLVVVTRDAEGRSTSRTVIPVRFVPQLRHPGQDGHRR